MLSCQSWKQLCGIIMRKAIFFQLLKNFPNFYANQRCLQQPDITPYSEPHESSTEPHILSLYYIFCYYVIIQIGFFPSDSRTQVCLHLLSVPCPIHFACIFLVYLNTKIIFNEILLFNFLTYSLSLTQYKIASLVQSCISLLLLNVT